MAGSVQSGAGRRPAPPVTEAGGGSPADGLGLDPDADGWLVGKARGGDTEALEVLIRRHRSRVYRVALRILGDRQDAEDVTQEVLIQVVTGLAGFAGGSSFTTWLYRIVVNRSLNHQRARRPTVPLEVDGRSLGGPPSSGPEDLVIARQRAAATAAAIAVLPDAQRAVFVLHQMEGLTYQEVAAILTVPEATVRGRLARARRSLFDRLREWA